MNSKRRISVFRKILVLVAVLFVGVCVFASCRHEHEYVSEITSEATCEKTGEITYRCSCGDSYTEEIPLKNHNLSTVFDDESGHYEKCADCDYVSEKIAHTMTEYIVAGDEHNQKCRFCDYAIDKVKHDFSILVSHEDATCVKQGRDVYKCVCGEQKETVIPIAEHSLTSYIKGDGKHWQKCDNCEYVTEKTEHDFDTLVSRKDATCKEKGNEVFKCVCGELKTNELDIVEHVYSKYAYDNDGHWLVCATCEMLKPDSCRETHLFTDETVSAPDCENVGLITHSCNCGYVYEEHPEALGHNPDKSQYVSRTQSGHYYMCLRCSEKVVESHDYVESDCENNREATCYKGGHQDYTCTVCRFKDERTSPRTDNHNFSAEWTTNGVYHWRVCLNGDGKTQCDAESGKEQHVFVEFTVEPTCTAIGHLYMRCECGHIQSNQNIPALGHDYEVTEVVKAATCAEQGEEIRTCKTCGDVITVYTDKLEHDWSLYEANRNAHYKKCSKCLAVQTGNPKNHTWTNEIVSAPTCTDNGVTKHTCGVCGFTYDEDTKATGHSMVTEDPSYTDTTKFQDPTCTEYGWHMEICTRCGVTEKKYGDILEPHQLVYYPAKEMTETERGNIAYHQCSVCEKYFATKNCEIELSEDEVFIYPPKVIDVESVEKLLEIVSGMSSGSMSGDIYRMTANVIFVGNKYFDIHDNISVDIPADVDASTINNGDTVTFKGKIYVENIDGELFCGFTDVEIISVKGSDGWSSLYISSNDTSGDTYVQSIYGGDVYVANVRYYNVLCPELEPEFTLNVSKLNYGTTLKLEKVLVNGKAYTVTGGVLTVAVDGDVNVELVFTDNPSTSVTLNKNVTADNQTHSADAYVSYRYYNGTGNDDGRLHANSHLTFEVNNANVVGIVITYENYNLDGGDKTVIDNTFFAGIDSEHKIKQDHTVNDKNKYVLYFAANDKISYLEYFADACQARITEITVLYSTNNTF